MQEGKIMDRAIPESITIDEALALMVNMDYIPAGLTVLDMTSAFLEEAEVEYENAKIDRLSEEQVSIFKVRFDVCTLRHELAENIQDALKQEINNIQNAMLVVAMESPVKRLTLGSVSEWAYDRYGIAIPIDIPIVGGSDLTNGSHRIASWEDVTIKIYKGYKIGWKVEGSKFQNSSFRKIGLMGDAQKSPNKQGGILIGLSQKKKFPIARTLIAADKTACSKLRESLFRLTGISDDPFYKYDPDQGWNPRFTLIDDRNNSDELLKKEAIHEQYDDDKHGHVNKDFEDEDDEAGDFLKDRS